MVRKGMMLALFLLLGTMPALAAHKGKKPVKKTQPPTYVQYHKPDGSVEIQLTIKSPDYRTLMQMEPNKGPTPDDESIGLPEVAEGTYILAGTYDTSKGNAEKFLVELVEADFGVASEVVTIPNSGKYGRRVLIRYENGEEFDRALDYIEEHNKREKDNIHPYLITKRDGSDTFSVIRKIEESYKEYVRIVAPPLAEPSTEKPGAPNTNAALKYYDLVLAAAKRYDMATQEDIALIYAIMHVESNMNPQARSSKGALGLMQVMPGTALLVDMPRHERKKLGFFERKRMLAQYEKILRDPKKNIEYGVAMIKDAKKRYGSNVAKIAADYNGGCSNVENPLPETVEYIAKVKRTLPGALAKVVDQR